MKKLITMLMVFTIAVTFITGCNGSKSESATAPDVPSASAETERKGAISTNGSTSMEKMIAALIEGFTASNPNVTITYDATGSSSGITAAIEGMADIGLSSRMLKSTETGVDATIIAYDGIAIIVNNINSVGDLSSEQIAGLFTGQMTNWSEVGGGDFPVVIIGREAGSGTRDGFESIMDVAEKCVYDQELTSTGAVIAAVASNQYAIGYASLSSVSDAVKSIMVNGIECSEETILDSSYAVQRPFIMATPNNKELSAEVKAFMEYALSSDATEIITNSGVVQARK